MKETAKKSKKRSTAAKKTGKASRTRTKTSEVAACPFCGEPFDSSGSHTCMKMPAPASESPHRETPPVLGEFDKIVQVIAWAQEKGALHIKTPYIEIVFPPPTLAETKVSSSQHDDALARESLKTTPSMQNPLNDPAYYDQAQEAFYDHVPQPAR